MKRFCTLKKLMFASLLTVAYGANGQTQHPLSFSTLVGTTVYNNWYKDYVGLRFTVVSPSSVAGEKVYEAANDGSGSSTQWGGYAGPIINTDIVMPQPGDSLATSPITTAMAGKIALIYRGVNQFVCKATAAQTAGAIACVIVNNVPGGPVGMGAGTDCPSASVTIPVFMISKEDGDALDALYCAGVVPKMTITPWGAGLQRDLGYVPQGISRWHNYAIPSYELVSSGNPNAYAGLDGAFVANYGTSKAMNVNLSADVTFTPTGGSTTSIHSNTVTLAGAFDNTTGSLPTASRNDSIWAMFMPKYDLTGITGKGRVNVKYTITSDSTDQFPADDTVSYSFYTTDSVYSKGRYDFTNGVPLSGLYTAASLPTSGEFFYTWGNAYFINKPGSAAKFAQWSMSHNSDTGDHITTIEAMNVYLFKWVDGYNFDGANVADSFMQNGELQLVGLGIKNFATSTLAGDTSRGVFSVQFGDSSGFIGTDPVLDAGSWYYVAAEVPSGWFMGCDGNNNCYPRTYGKAYFNSSVEYYSPEWSSGRYSGTSAMVVSPGSGYAPAPFGLSGGIDSTIFSTQKGLIPSLALATTTHPSVFSSVKNVNQAFAKFNLYPNPATDYVNVALELDNAAKDVTYTVIDGNARTISKETHRNVSKETYQFATKGLASGNYYMIVSAGDRQMFKKFSVVR